MQISILPKTYLGKWSVGLVAAFILLSVVHGLVTPPRPSPSAPVLPPSTAVVAMGISRMVALIIGLASAVAGSVTGLISTTRNRERSILVFLAVVVGFFVLMFCLGEVIFPH
ncbi:MAG: hypothetical protein FJZ94_06735 [Chloroflexi bacterium]|nr:hypothetical protein [Chloroflexota bacterium]